MGARITFHPGDAGITLVELLVVMSVLAVLAVGTGLAVGRPPGPGENDAARFEEGFNRQRAMAIAGGERLGLRLNAKGMQTLRLGPAGWVETGRLRRWHGRAVMLPPAAGSPVSPPDTPELVFLPDGRTTAVSVGFSGGSARAWRCESDGWTGLTCDDL